MEADALLDDLDPGQRLAVTSTATPLAILAPAGSGKTRVLTRRIAYRVGTGTADSQHVLALTFTRKAAGELKSRLRRLGLRDEVSAGTFHALAYAQLRTRWADQRREPPTLVASKAPILAALVSKTRSSASWSDLAAEIEWAKSRRVAPEGYVAAVTAAGRRPPLSPEAMAGKYADYEERMRAARQVDFDDLLGLCLHALETDDEFTATQRWRFRHLFVDEFQDVNPLQFQLLEAWRGERYDVCVVGDPQQAIYGWNGADASFLIDIRRHYPPVEVVALDRNYRSSPQILASAASALRLAKLGHHDIVAMRPDGPLPTVTSHPTDRDEAIAIARAVRDHHAPGARWGAQAVLVRTNAQSALIEEALRSANVPTRVRGGKDFLDRQEVRRAIRFLRDATVPLGTALADLEAELEQQDAGEPTIDRQDGLADPTANVEMLIRLGHDFVRLAPGGSPSGFVAWLNATIQAEGPDATGDAVDIATFHSAKGLEWPIVHLAGMEDGYVPITHARTAATRAEEARLLYVAMTRAERQLLCTWAEQRTFGARTVARVLSPLLADVAADRAAPAGPPAERVPDWRERVAEQRAMLAASAPRPGPALEALRRWRDEAARAARIEPATLLGDRLLEAVADQRPTDHEGLASIPGMGAILVARFGDAMLTALDATAGEEGAG